MTLAEVLMAFAILSIGVLGFIGSFLNVSKSINSSKTRAIATNLVQEKIESMKNISYYRLLPTTVTVSSDEPGIPVFQYDTGYYPPETLQVGGISFTRRVYVEKVTVGVGGSPSHVASDGDETGLKRIKAYVLWNEAKGWKMAAMENMLNNPAMRKQTGTFKGTIQSTMSVPLEGVTVSVLQNGSWSDLTNSAGGYAFAVTPGSYTLQASLSGYFPAQASKYVAQNSTTTWDTQLARMSSGTLTGNAYLRDHLVISRVLGSSQAVAGIDQEYVEVFNPTTYTWTMSGAVGLKFQRQITQDAAERTISINWVTAGIAPGGFYLFANTNTITVANGVSVAADAIWASTNPVTDFPYFSAGDPNIIVVKEDGANTQGCAGLRLYRLSDGSTIDRIGWEGNGHTTPPIYETLPINQDQGLNRYEQFYRLSSTNPATDTSNGPAYDTDNNAGNWGIQAPVSSPPRNSLSAIQPIISGTPASGATVAADDGLSAATVCSSSGAFVLAGVATGTWNVTFATSTYFVQVSTTVNDSATYSMGSVGITSTTTEGFITGTVYNTASSPLNNIRVQASGMLPNPTTTGVTGKYFLHGATEPTTVVANPGNYDTSYVSLSSESVTVSMGQFTENVNFYLDTGARIRGRVVIGASTPLPGIPVIASTSSLAVAEGVTDSSGYFIIQNLSTGSYSVIPQLEPGESYSPTTSVSLTSPGTLVWSATFTVSNAFGWISGSVLSGGQNIQTGVLIVATTGTITTTNPPDITDSVRTGVQKYYAVSSLADGTYTLHVPGGSGTPITYNVYGWYTKFSGTTPSTQKVSTTAAVTGGQTTSGRDLSWP